MVQEMVWGMVQGLVRGMVWLMVGEWFLKCFEKLPLHDNNGLVMFWCTLQAKNSQRPMLAIFGRFFCYFWSLKCTTTLQNYFCLVKNF